MTCGESKRRCEDKVAVSNPINPEEAWNMAWEVAKEESVPGTSNGG